jgi:hypothetical protein
MLDLLRDPIWQFAGAVLAIISPKPEATPIRQEDIPTLITVILGAGFFGVAYIRFALRVVKRPNFRRRLMRVLARG